MLNVTKFLHNLLVCKSKDSNLEVFSPYLEVVALRAVCKTAVLSSFSDVTSYLEPQ